MLDDIEDHDGTEESEKSLLAARSELLAQIDKWTPVFNATLHPALEAAAQAAVTAQVSQDASVPPSFPMRDNTLIHPEVTGRAARAELGLPPLRNPKKKSDLWSEVFAYEIPLPSSFDARVLAQSIVEPLVNWEVKVREGQLNDALNDVRTHMVTSEVLKLKKHDTSTKATTTRMGKKIRRKHDQVVAAADEYRRARLAMLSLGMQEGDPRFPALRKQDLTKFTLSSEHQQLGESRRRVSWIWDSFAYADKQGDERFKEFHDDGESYDI